MTDSRTKLGGRCAPTGRRSFLKRSTLAAASVMVVSPHVLGGPGKTPPSDQFRFAQIGVGGQGARDVRQMMRAGGTPVALCDVDVQRAGKTFCQHPDVERFTDYRIMLEEFDKEFDAVVVSTPDHTHAAIALAAMRHGKHVYLQCPMARTFDEVRRLQTAADESGLAIQVGNQGHSSLHMRAFDDFINRGELGEIQSVHCWTDRPEWPQGMTATPVSSSPPVSLDWDLWLGPVADRPYSKGYLPTTWRGWWDFGTGAMGDMGCHLLDPAFTTLGLQLPRTVTADCETATSISYPVWSQVEMEFDSTDACPNGLKLTWYDGGKQPDTPTIIADETSGEPGYSAGGSGCMIVGEKMTLVGSTLSSEPDQMPQIVAVASEDDDELANARRAGRERVEQLSAESSESSKSHYEQWIRAAREGKSDSIDSDRKTAGNMTQAALLGCIATRFPGQTLTWDNAKQSFAGSDEASSFLSFEPREGHSFEA
ncbi:Gfo/Idh/MocA family protein [Rhodopirellula bahusiensis]|uniref:Dehydrogenase n=1 Tax=Rhodopirellula bahusiensis TaxID=2014065 RepID=A0A2G1W2Q1_9BACT|nr:Gfo/Idh/MocA family oxidoreductase [Rhodopirellula bahusiensis]PHQ32949.1 dehydrogenase [Rhodopirellula bahusiensis]